MSFMKWVLGAGGALFAATFAIAADAATIRFETPQEAYRPHTEFPVSVIIDTAGEEVNALEAAIQVTGATVVDIRDGDSAVPLWPLRPKADGNNRIPFAGIFPGGRVGDGLLLFTLVLRGGNEGSVSIQAEEARVLRNDGRATEIQTVAVPLETRIQETAAVWVAAATASDREPPDQFTPLVIQDSFVANGAYALLFLAQDKESGVHHYEVFETPREITRDTDIRWIRGESPYVLADQTRGSFVYIKAIDRVGNERIERVDPARTRAWYEEKEHQDLIVWVIGFIFILCYPFYRYPWKKKGKPFYIKG